MQAPRRSVLVVAQLAAAGLLFYFVGQTLAGQWATLKTQRLETDLDAVSLVTSAVLVFATYGLLIQLWRLLVTSAGASLPFWPAVRIWAISGLWRYVPGKVWSIGAMGAMAHRANVPAATAAGSAVLNVVVNIAAGIAISLVLTWRWLTQANPGAKPVAILLLVAALVGLLALPYAVPRLAKAAGRLLGREVSVQAPPRWALALAVAGNMFAWALYGLAFMWLVRGVLGHAAGAPWQYIAVFTASYVVGYLFLFVPGGIGPREAVMVELLVSLELTSVKEALFVAAISRIWLTILELVPGLVLLAQGRASRSPRNNLPTDASSQ